MCADAPRARLRRGRSCLRVYVVATAIKHLARHAMATRSEESCGTILAAKARTLIRAHVHRGLRRGYTIVLHHLDGNPLDVLRTPRAGA